MTWSRALSLIALIVVAVALVGGALGLLPFGGGGSGSTDGRVVRVVDGDTVHVALPGGQETVRYIGMDTPESVKPHTPVQCFSKRASARNRALVAGREVTLRFDAERRDRYGRLLAYVYRRSDGLFVNAELVREGLARGYPFPPNTSHARAFADLERGARSHDRGLWRTCPHPFARG